MSAANVAMCEKLRGDECVPAVHASLCYCAIGVHVTVDVHACSRVVPGMIVVCAASLGLDSSVSVMIHHCMPCLQRSFPSGIVGCSRH